MNFANILLKAITPTWEKRSNSGGVTIKRIAEMLNPHRSEDSAYQLTAVLDGIRLISDSMAMMPIAPYRRHDTGRTKLTKHPNFNLLQRRPNTYQNAYDWWRIMEWNVLAHGNGYSVILRDESLRATDLIPVHPKNVTVKYDFVNKRRWYVITQDDIKGTLRQEDVLHFMGPSTDGITGISPLTFCRISIQLGTKIQNFGKDLYENGSHVKGFLQAPDVLDVETFDSIKDQLKKSFYGKGSAGSIPLLEAGVEYKSVGIDPVDAEFILNRQFTVEEVARMLNIPPAKLKHMKDAHYNNVESMDLQYQQQTLLPIVKAREQELDMKLLYEDEKQDLYHEFNMNAILRADMDTRSKFYNAGTSNGWLVINDVREMENKDHVEGGDKPRIPTFTMLPEQQEANHDKTLAETDRIKKQTSSNNRRQMLFDKMKEISENGNGKK